MKMMELALHQLAGPHIYRFLETATKTPAHGLATGTALTALLQSSSAVTVISIGLVNAGVLTFPRTLGIILGTNIGTCLTTELIGLNAAGIAIPLLLASAAVWLGSWLVSPGAGPGPRTAAGRLHEARGLPRSADLRGNAPTSGAPGSAELAPGGTSAQPAVHIHGGPGGRPQRLLHTSAARSADNCLPAGRADRGVRLASSSLRVDSRRTDPGTSIPPAGQAHNSRGQTGPGGGRAGKPGKPRRWLHGVRYAALAASGFSLVLIGIQIMQSIGPALENLGLFAWFIEHAKISLLWGIAAGAAVAALIHSSSAVIVMSMGFAASGVISPELGIAITIGSNVGTCITAWMASIGGTRAGVFVAWSHILLNVGGAALFFPMIGLLHDVSAWMTSDPSAQIARAQTLFNIACSLIALPLCYLPFSRSKSLQPHT
ncbi:Na/Pi symporter [Paenibacillus lutrae]